jgi:hypothetical protein
MRAKLRQDSPGVPANHTSPKGNTRWAGRTLLALILLSRTVTFTAGCTPDPGTEGGSCKGDACHGYCDDGLTCGNDDKCHPAQAPPSSSGAACWTDESSACGDAAAEYVCNGGATPAQTLALSTCAPSLSYGGGLSTFCCSLASDGGLPDAGIGAEAADSAEETDSAYAADSVRASEAGDGGTD